MYVAADSKKLNLTNTMQSIRQGRNVRAQINNNTSASQLPNTNIGAWQGGDHDHQGGQRSSIKSCSGQRRGAGWTVWTWAQKSGAQETVDSIDSHSR